MLTYVKIVSGILLTCIFVFILAGFTRLMYETARARMSTEERIYLISFVSLLFLVCSGTVAFVAWVENDIEPDHMAARWYKGTFFTVVGAFGIFILSNIIGFLR